MSKTEETLEADDDNKRLQCIIETKYITFKGTCFIHIGILIHEGVVD